MDGFGETQTYGAVKIPPRTTTKTIRSQGGKETATSSWALTGSHMLTWRIIWVRLRMPSLELPKVEELSHPQTCSRISDATKRG
jgi:hypothetical protein